MFFPFCVGLPSQERSTQLRPKAKGNFARFSFLLARWLFPALLKLRSTLLLTWHVMAFCSPERINLTRHIHDVEVPPVTLSWLSLRNYAPDLDLLGLLSLVSQMDSLQLFSIRISQYLQPVCSEAKTRSLLDQHQLASTSCPGDAQQQMSRRPEVFEQ